MFSKAIIDKLQAARRARFPQYDQILLDVPAVPLFARLFLNPDCQTDIDLFSLSNESVKLSYLGDHIITAAPSTLAQYAERVRKTVLTDEDLLRCFALDHAHDVHDNAVAEDKNPAYALAHILNLSRVVSFQIAESEITATLAQPTIWGSITFRHVVVPHDLPLQKNEWVYHHFGVIVARADDRDFATKLVSLQRKDDFLAGLGNILKRKRITIDFANAGMFGKNILHMILKPATTKIITNPGDLIHGKINFKH